MVVNTANNLRLCHQQVSVIRKVSLHNWTSHENTTIEFSKGANIFIGSMGSGKTSVLDAICYALYGKIPKLTRNSKLEDLISFGQDCATVELLLEANGKELLIKREIRGKGRNNAWLYVDGKLYEQSTSKVTSAIERILDMTYDIFTRAVYSEQNSIDLFLSLQKAERKAVMDRLMGIDKLRDAAKKATRVKGLLVSKKKEQEMLLDGWDSKEKKKTYEKFVEELQSLAKEGEELKASITKIKSDCSVKEKNLREEEEKEKKWQLLNDKLNNIKGKIATFRTSYEKREEMLKRLDDIREKSKTLAAKKKSIVEEITSLQSKRDAIIKSLSDGKQKIESIKSMEKELEETEQLIKRFTSKDLDAMKVEREKLLLEKKASISSLKAVLAESERAIEHIKEAREGKCPTCNTVLGKEGIEKVVEYWEEKKENAKKGIKEGREAVDKLSDDIAKLDSFIKKRDVALNKADLLRSRVAKLKESLPDIDSLNEEFAQLQKLMKDKESDKADVEERLSTLSKDLVVVERVIKEADIYSKAREEQKALELELSELSFNKELLRKLNSELSSYLSLLKEKEALLSTIEKRKASIMKAYSSLAEEIERFEREERRFEKTKELLEKMSYVCALLEQFQGARRKFIVQSLNSALNNLWSSIYPYSDYREVMIEASEDDYKFYLFNGTERKALESIASGGERTSFALALRLALSLVLTGKLNWLILDEPTHNLDERAISSLVEVVRTRLPSIVGQFFIVTHDERLKNEDLGSIFLFDRGREKTDRTRVSLLE
ncbi:MAG: SMC family ATPase [Methanobacteriota archaeon]|nr:MAG: SMC family ATPase [Euryarchaeota archaeon]